VGAKKIDREDSAEYQVFSSGNLSMEDKAMVRRRAPWIFASVRGKEFSIFHCSFGAGAVKDRTDLRGEKISGAVKALEE
jgi:hypothetical protein